jgi:glycosyltransferase involved in cell wall biosynthesis
MKIAVYTIALNEEDNVQEWYDSAKDADYLLIADTGSTDKTKRIAKKLGIKVVDISVKPWRFDDARNAALALLPDDIDMCISLDLDERLSEGWRKDLESIDPSFTQLQYKYIWSWRDPQSRTQPQVVYLLNKVHARHGYRWKYLVHELVFPDRNKNHKEGFIQNFEIHHYSNQHENTDRYSDMIFDAFEEEKDNKRYWIYKIAALMASDKKEAKKTILEYLDKFKNDLAEIEKSRQYKNLFICTSNKKYIYKASKHSPDEREFLVDIAMLNFIKNKYRKTRKYCNLALRITSRVLDYEYKEYVWGFLAKNMLYVSNHNMKFKNRKNKLYLNINSMTASSFDLFTKEDVL